MSKYIKTKELVANIAALFGRTKTKRRYIRDKIRFKNLIQSVCNKDFPIKKYNKKIDIAFCFNDKGCELAMVSIKSLLVSGQGRCDYKIYCVIDNGVSKNHKKAVSDLVLGTKSEIVFLDANHDFDKSYLLGWPVAIYYRTMLPKLLPDLDKIIYADIDVIFYKDLIELSNIDMGNNILAGVKDYSNGYINSGFLVMNLKEIRNIGLYDKWISASQIKKYKNPDQDLLNYTARGKIIFLPLKYNLQTMRGNDIYKTCSVQEIEDLKHNLVVMHYSNWMKPWHEKSGRPIYSEHWWMFANQVPVWRGKY